jgi:hypothetical protein
MPDYVYALHDFVPEHDDEVSFRAGERIEVIERDEVYQDGWWTVSATSMFNWFCKFNSLYCQLKNKDPAPMLLIRLHSYEHFAGFLAFGKTKPVGRLLCSSTLKSNSAGLSAAPPLLFDHSILIHEKAIRILVFLTFLDTVLASVSLSIRSSHFSFFNVRVETLRENLVSSQSHTRHQRLPHLGFLQFRHHNSLIRLPPVLALFTPCQRKERHPCLYLSRLPLLAP